MTLTAELSDDLSNDKSALLQSSEIHHDKDINKNSQNSDSTKYVMLSDKAGKESNLLREIVLSFAYPMEFVSELPDSTWLGTWYLTPEYHIIEAWIMSMFAISLLFISTTMTENTPQPSLIMEQTLIEKIMKYVLSMDYLIHMSFKTKSTPKGRGLWWMLQPCAVNHLVLTFFLWNPSLLTHTVLLYLITLTSGALNAILFPDLSNINLIEKINFWFQHLSIFLLPYYWLIKNAKLIENISIWYSLGAHALLMLYCFVILLFCDIISGVNINYMLSPPNTKILTDYKRKYRIVMSCYMIIVHCLCGYIIPNMLLFICIIKQQ